MRYRKALRFAGIVLFIAGVGGFLTLHQTAAHWWKRNSAAAITCNDRLSEGSVAYESPDGNILLRLESGGFYIVQFKSKQVGYANSTHFIEIFGYLYSKFVPPLILPLAKNNPKTEIDPKLKLGSGYLEFAPDEPGCKRVRVDY